MNHSITTSTDMKIDRQVLKRVAELKIQAMLFDMEVDLEANTLAPKKPDTTPFWAKRWREHEKSGDKQPEDYEGGKDER